MKVDVSNNEIPSIPDGIVNLADLQLIRMKNNKVKEIPACLIGLGNLKSLDVSRNMVVSLPQNISEWPSLVELNISENQVQNCPNLERVKSLEVLYINDNKLQAMPTLGVGVKKVEASSNRISEIRRRTFEECSNL